MNRGSFQISLTAFFVSASLSVMSPIAQAASASILDRYQHSALTQEIATEMRTASISNSLKNSLLANARAEDMTYVKAMIVNWKAAHEDDIHVEFDRLILTDDEGEIGFVIQPISANPTTLQIGNRTWVAPEKGSIEASLRSFLAESKSASRSRDSRFSSLAALLSPSHAHAAKNDRALAATTKSAYLFTAKLSNDSVTANDAIQTDSPVPNLREGPKSTFSSLRKLLGDSGIQVTCRGSTAQGWAQLGPEKFAFETRADGQTILTSSSQKKLLVTPQVIDMKMRAESKIAELKSFKKAKSGEERERIAAKILREFERGETPTELARFKKELRSKAFKAPGESTSFLREHIADLEKYWQSRQGSQVFPQALVRRCLNNDCSKLDTSLESTSTIYPWIDRSKAPEVAEALKWKPKDPKSKARIINSNLYYYRLDNPGGRPLSKQDQKASQEILARVQNAEVTEALKIFSAQSSLLPLGTCCTDTKCRASLEASNVNVRSESGATTK